MCKLVQAANDYGKCVAASVIEKLVGNEVWNARMRWK